MRIDRSVVMLLGLLAALAGCADMTARPVDIVEHEIKDLCIKSVDQLVPPDFTYILKESFHRHGISTTRYKTIPDSCEYWLSYRVTLQEDHTNLAINDVHMALYKKDRLIGFADRDAPKGFLGKQVIDLSQWDSTRSIVEPLVDQLLDPEAVSGKK